MLNFNSKLVEVVTVADVDSEDHVGNSLLQIWELTFGPKTKLFSDFEDKGWSASSPQVATNWSPSCPLIVAQRG